MMMVEAEEGSPAVEYGRAEKEECGDDSDIIDLDSFWRILGEPAYPPQVNSAKIFFYFFIFFFDFFAKSAIRSQD